MKIKVNGCVDCGLQCLQYCEKRDDTYEWRCDECGEEDTLYYFDDKELCLDCIKQRLEIVNY